MASKFKYTYPCYCRSEILYDVVSEDDVDVDDEACMSFNADYDSQLTPEYIENLNNFLQENDTPMIAAVDIECGSHLTTITIYSNNELSKEDLTFIVQTIGDDISPDTYYFEYSGDLEYDGWDPTTDYGYVSKSEYRDDLEGEADFRLYTNKVVFKK